MAVAVAVTHTGGCAVGAETGGSSVVGPVGGGTVGLGPGMVPFRITDGGILPFKRTCG